LDGSHARRAWSSFRSQRWRPHHSADLLPERLGGGSEPAGAVVTGSTYAQTVTADSPNYYWRMGSTTYQSDAEVNTTSHTPTWGENGHSVPGASGALLGDSDTPYTMSQIVTTPSQPVVPAVTDEPTVRPSSFVRISLVAAGVILLVGSAASGSLWAILLSLVFAVVLGRWSGVSVSANRDGVVVRNTWKTVRVPWEQVQGWLILGNGVALLRSGTDHEQPLQVSAVRSMNPSPERRFAALQSVIAELSSVNPRGSKPVIEG
jgi:hypothetical protein